MNDSKFSRLSESFTIGEEIEQYNNQSMSMSFIHDISIDPAFITSGGFEDDNKDLFKFAQILNIGTQRISEEPTSATSNKLPRLFIETE